MLFDRALWTSLSVTFQYCFFCCFLTPQNLFQFFFTGHLVTKITIATIVVFFCFQRSLIFSKSRLTLGIYFFICYSTVGWLPVDKILVKSVRAFKSKTRIKFFVISCSFLFLDGVSISWYLYLILNNGAQIPQSNLKAPTLHQNCIFLKTTFWFIWKRSYRFF